MVTRRVRPTRWRPVVTPEGTHSMTTIGRRIAAAALAVVATAATATTATPAATAKEMSTISHPVLTAQATRTGAAAQADQAGPHSPRTRKAAKPKVGRLPGVQVLEFDFGDVELGKRKGQFRSPMRGVLVVPERTRNAPLVVVNHLRMPGCTNDVLAYPCPKGAKELRLDHGMSYLGVDLARQGYAVLIPDLSPLWIGGQTARPYDQIAGWQKIVGGMRDRVAAANRGRGGFGTTLTGRIDTSRSALVVHSRSAYIVEPAVKAWRRTSPVASVFAYGPASNVDDPAAPDVPYLIALGGADDDVTSTPSHWVSKHLGVPRRSPLGIAIVPGLGHSYINRTLARAGLDDRKGCDRENCPNARAHQVFMQNAVSAWLDTTYRGRPAVPGRASLPMRPDAPLPSALGGRRVQWLAVTNSPNAVPAYDSTSGIRGVRAIGGGKIKACHYREAMDPTVDRHRCSDPEAGVIAALGPVLQVGLTPTGGAHLQTRAVRGVRQVTVAVNPTGSRADKRPGTSLRVTLIDSTGGRHHLDVPALGEAMRNRHSRTSEGTYTPTTLRLPVPEGLRDKDVVGIELTGHGGTGNIDIRRIDLMR